MRDASDASEPEGPGAGTAGGDAGGGGDPDGDAKEGGGPEDGEDGTLGVDRTAGTPAPGAREALAWSTTGTGVDYTCPGFDVRRDDVWLPDGTETDYHYVEEPPAVVVLPLTGDGEVVVIDEWRQAVGRVNRGVPTGSVEPGERPAAAARRELAEETGHEARSVERRLVVEPANGIAASVHHHFVARGCTPTAERDLDDNESIRVETVAFEDLLAAAVDGRVRDARATLAVLQHHLAGR